MTGTRVVEIGCVRAALPVDLKTLKRRGRLADYAAFRDDAAKPRLTVPNTKLI